MSIIATYDNLTILCGFSLPGNAITDSLELRKITSELSHPLEVVKPSETRPSSLSRFETKSQNALFSWQERENCKAGHWQILQQNLYESDVFHYGS
jgi:hypothetical protein